MNRPFHSEDELVSFLKEKDLQGLDSEYSILCSELIEKYSAKGMDLNRWWVFTPTNWECPSCGRLKSEIVRLNKHGYLSGHLHEHHDHMSDFVNDEFTRISQNRSLVIADLKAERFVKRTAFAFSAYDNTIICSDCNSADAKAKKITKSPKEFSFSPDEIRKFIIIAPNQEHKINESVAMKVWEESKETFTIRCNFVKQIAELAASNTHWYQTSENTARQVERAAEYYMDYYGLKDINHVNPEGLLYKSNKFSGEKDSWRRNQKVRENKPPTKGEIQHLINLDNGLWEKTPDSWACPICMRSKLECVRKSNAGQWKFLLCTSKVFYSHESQDHCQYQKVCNDCNTTATHIGSEAESIANIKLSFSSASITPQELGKVIISTPHSKHMVNNDAVDNLMVVLADRILSGSCRN